MTVSFPIQSASTAAEASVKSVADVHPSLPRCERKASAVAIEKVMIRLSKALDDVREISLADEFDCFNQENFLSLAQKNLHEKYIYYIAVVKDTSNDKRIFDGASFLRNYFTFERNFNPLNRQAILKAHIYGISTLKTLDKTSLPEAHFVSSLEDLKPQTGNSSVAKEKNLRAELIKAMVGASDLNCPAEDRGEDQAQLGNIFEKKGDFDQALLWYRRAARNNSWYAFTRLIEIEPGIKTETVFSYLNKAILFCTKSYNSKKKDYEDLLSKSAIPSDPLIEIMRKKVLELENFLGFTYAQYALFHLSAVQDPTKALGALKQAKKYMTEEAFKSFFEHLPDEIKTKLTEQTKPPLPPAASPKKPVNEEKKNIPPSSPQKAKTSSASAPKNGISHSSSIVSMRIVG